MQTHSHTNALTHQTHSRENRHTGACTDTHVHILSLCLSAPCLTALRLASVYSVCSVPAGGAVKSQSFPKTTTRFLLSGLQPGTEYLVTLYTLYEGREEATPASTSSAGQHRVKG